MKTIAPPDPNTRKPAYQAPPGSCDAHCHVFGPGELFPYAPARKYTPPDSPKEKLRELHDILGIDRAVIVQASCHGTDNAAMLDAIAAGDGRYRGVCNADESFSSCRTTELKRYKDCRIRSHQFAAPSCWRPYCRSMPGRWSTRRPLQFRQTPRRSTGP